MGARSFDDEIAQIPSRDGADRYFEPNNTFLITFTHTKFNSSIFQFCNKNGGL